MDTQSLLIFQIVADIVLCAAILFLLKRIGLNVGRKAGPPAVDAGYLADFQRLIEESRVEGERFSRTMDESCRKFKELAAQMGEKETSLAGLIEEAKQIFARSDRPESRRDSDAGTGYEQAVKLLKAGTPVAEAARQAGLTEGEVSLILNLAQSSELRAESL